MSFPVPQDIAVQPLPAARSPAPHYTCLLYTSTHTSVAILDALKAVNLPAVEVHLSDVGSREDFRQISYAGMACEKTITGKGFQGYIEALVYLKEKYQK